MAADPAEDFSRLLSTFRNRLSQQDIDDFQCATVNDLRKCIDDIQIEQAQRRRYRNLNKIKTFVNGVQQYTKVIEVFVSAKPDILAFIWVCVSRQLQGEVLSV